MTTNEWPVWKWISTVQVGPIEYGMTSAAVRKLFPETPVADRIKHPLYGEQDVDRYETFSVFYNKGGEAEKVSISPSGRAPKVFNRVWEEDHDLIHTSFEELRSFLLKRRKHWTIEEDGWLLRSSLLDIEVYGPSWSSMKDGVRVSDYPGSYASAVVFYAPNVIRQLLKYRREKEFELLEALFEKANKQNA